MSAISTNPFATGIPAGSYANEPAPADPGGRRTLAAATDSFAPATTFPTNDDGFGATPVFSTGEFGGANDGLSGFESIANGFITGLQSMLASLGRSFGLGGSPSSAPPSTPSGGQTYFSNATASSVGDPHDAFAGTTASGNVTSGKWDSMGSHGDLLSSDSFDGGYRVSTTVTAPNAKGVTLNANATVTTDGGNASVTMNADGSYAVSSSGNAVSLAVGTPVSLGNGETVTLDADKSLTVADDNGAGGTIVTTLRRNGDGGVDVSSTANDVDLGGYLVNRSDRAGDAPDPRRPQPQVMTTATIDGIELA